MKKKKLIIIIIIIVIMMIFALWLSGIIPKQIARISATNYLEKNFPKIELDYVSVENDSSTDGYLIIFKDKNEGFYKFIMTNRYLPINIDKGLFDFEKKYREEYENTSNTPKETIVQFKKTYTIIADLKKTDLIGENNYYVIEQYQLETPIVIKINSNYQLQENANYEFLFEGKKIEGKEYSIQEIFDTFKIIKIEKTSKVGMDQLQDEI